MSEQVQVELVDEFDVHVELSNCFDVKVELANDFEFQCRESMYALLQDKDVELGAAMPTTTTADFGYDAIGSVTYTRDNTIIRPENIRKNVTILDVTGIFEGGMVCVEYDEETIEIIGAIAFDEETIQL